MADNNNQCAHKMCSCAVNNDNEYCSNHCEDAADQDLTEIQCDCGHSGCVTEV